MNNYSFSEIIEKIDEHFGKISSEELDRRLSEAGIDVYMEHKSYVSFTYSSGVKKLPDSIVIDFKNEVNCADSYFPYQVAA